MSMRSPKDRKHQQMGAKFKKSLEEQYQMKIGDWGSINQSHFFKVN
jgi:hypothetical protein